VGAWDLERKRQKTGENDDNQSPSTSSIYIRLAHSASSDFLLGVNTCIGYAAEQLSQGYIEIAQE